MRSAANANLGTFSYNLCLDESPKDNFKNWAIPGLFFFIFVFLKQLTVNVQYKCLPMTGFEPQTSGIGSKSSTN